MSPQRRRLVVILAVLLGTPVMGAGTAYDWINGVADRRWAEAESRIHALSAAFPEGGTGRGPEPRSEAAKENQIHFVAAIRLAAPKRLGRVNASKYIDERTRGEEVDHLLEEAQDFLDRLHEGARRIAASPVDFPSRWHGEWDYVTLVYVMQCAVLRSRAQRAVNRAAEAAETLLDSLQLARFWAISGPEGSRGSALGGMAETVDELRDLLSSAALPSEQLCRIENELEPLEAALEMQVRRLEPFVARWAEKLRTADLNENGVLREAPLWWRVLFPERLIKADVFAFVERQLEDLRIAESKGYDEVLRVGKRAQDEADISRNPFLRRAGNLLEAVGWGEIERKAQLRLLRTAAHYRATGDVLKLQDPFGTVLGHAATPTGMKFWSRWGDGKDDGGDPGGRKGWLGPQNAPILDLVIEVERHK